MECEFKIRGHTQKSEDFDRDAERGCRTRAPAPLPFEMGGTGALANYYTIIDNFRNAGER